MKWLDLYPKGYKKHVFMYIIPDKVQIYINKLGEMFLSINRFHKMYTVAHNKKHAKKLLKNRVRYTVYKDNKTHFFHSFLEGFMINKKVMALLLSASMAFTASVPVLADYYDSFTGSYKVSFELEDGGKNYGYVYYADGTHKKEEVDVEVSENSITGTDIVYSILQSPNAYGSYSWNIYTPVIKNDNDKKANRVYYFWNEESELSDDFYKNHSWTDIYLTPTNDNIEKKYVLSTQAASYNISFAPSMGFLSELVWTNYTGDKYYEGIIVDNGDGTYSQKEVVPDSSEDWEGWYGCDDYIVTDKSTGYKYKVPKYTDAPKLTQGYEFEKWVDATTIFNFEKDCIEGNLPEVSGGEEIELPELSGYGSHAGNYIAVFKEVGKTNDKIVEKTVSSMHAILH